MTRIYKQLSGNKIHRIAKKYNHPKLAKIFNKDETYKYEEFKRYILENMDNYQTGGGPFGIDKIIKGIFNGIFNSDKYKSPPQNKENILPHRLSEVQIAYNDLHQSIGLRLPKFSIRDYFNK
jgi:hypothetical protein